MNLPSFSKITITTLATLAIFLASLTPLALHAQSALIKEHENELAAAEQKLQAVQADPKATDAQKAEALSGKGAALALVGRHAEALPLLRQAEKLNPDNPITQLRIAQVLDAAGNHQQAREKFDQITASLSAWMARQDAKAKNQKQNKDEVTDEDAEKYATGLMLPSASGINYAHLGQYDKALTVFEAAGKFSQTVADMNELSDYYACWRLWLVAKLRAENAGTRNLPSLVTLARTLKVSTSYHKALLRLYAGEASWDDVLAAIDSMKITDAEKENFRTEAHFFGAGYFRYVKRDNATALALLKAEDARPFNGCDERALIRKELASLAKIAAL